jgi:DNA-binding LytR/AlgR family response regulator
LNRDGDSGPPVYESRHVRLRNLTRDSDKRQRISATYPVTINHITSVMNTTDYVEVITADIREAEAKGDSKKLERLYNELLQILSTNEEKVNL